MQLRRSSDAMWWRRWLESRWMLITMVTLGAQFYLSINAFDPDGVFARVAIVAIGAGQMHNTFAKRPQPRAPTLEEDK